MKTFLALLAFAGLARADDAQTAIRAIETENHVKFVGEAPINGSNRTQWIFAAPDTAKGIRIRIHVISHPSRLEYLAAELSAYGEVRLFMSSLKSVSAQDSDAIRRKLLK